MMKPKEKAQEIFNKMYQVDDIMGNYPMCFDTAKKCALIAVEEILNARPLDPSYVDWDDCGAAHKYWYEAQQQGALEFWQEVKSELQSF